MKICSICRQENEDAAVYCLQCGAGEFLPPGTRPTTEVDSTVSAPNGAPDDWFSVLSAAYPLQADIVAGRLRSSGIEARISTQSIGGVGPYLELVGGQNAYTLFRDVEVQQKDFIAAKALLASTDNSPA